MNTKLPLKIGRDAYNEGQLLCPVCGFEYVHLANENRVKHVPGNDNYEADADKSIRGDVIRLSAFCENGHCFDICIGFHKGLTPIWAEQTPDQPIEEIWK